MTTLNIPAAPFLIAFILGPIFGDNLRRSLDCTRRSDFFVKDFRAFLLDRFYSQ